MRTQLACMAILAAAGCTSIDVHEVTDDKSDKGIRYYEPAAYLLVVPDTKGGLSVRVVYLPDRSRLMSARPTSWLSSNTTDLKFSNGVLTEGQHLGDASAVPKAVVEAVAKALSAAALNAPVDDKSADSERRAPAPTLLRIRVNGDEVEVYGDDTVGPDGKSPFYIKVRIPKAS